MILIVSSFIVLKITGDRFEEMSLGKKYHSIVRMVMKECRSTQTINDELQRELEAINFEVIEDRKKFEEILTLGKVKGKLKRNEHMQEKILEYEKNHYIYIKTPYNHFLLKDKNEIDSNSYIFVFLFGLILMSMLFLFFTVIKKLYPIKKLQEKVVALGDEEFDFDCCNTNGKDEISILAKEFSKSAKKLHNIKEARNLFIRNIMHELKTPITKGKFLMELPHNEENNRLMQKVFYRLEGLINEFASIEEMMSTQNIVKKEYFLSDIIDNALDLMIGAEEGIEIDIKDEKVLVNFKLFSIAIKNLLDNGLKYSSNKQVTIQSSNNTIEVINTGDSLQYPLEYYFEPFKKEIITSEGFGLGLYITNSILKAHGCKFTYQHKDGKNIFMIELDKQ